MKKGNTLIELIIYITIVSGIGMASVLFVTNIITGRVKSSLEENVIHNMRLSTRRITQEIRQATAITSISSTDLCLASPTIGRNPTRIYLSSNRLYLGFGGSCASSTTSYPLTSTNVTVSNLVFSNSTTGLAKTIDYTYKISGNNVVGRQEWLYDTTASMSASIR
jgi:type II secretory pathway pseudopilin PulG